VRHDKPLPHGLRRAALATAAAFVLSACSVLGGGEPPRAIYDVSAPSGLADAGTTAAQLLIPEPNAIGALDTERIAVRPDSVRIEYLAGSQWTDRVPVLVQARLIEAFENAGIAAVGRPGESLAIDYRVIVDVRSFEFEALTHTARVALAVRLLDDRDGRVVAQQTFTGASATATDSAGDIVLGLDAALGTALSGLVRWTLAAV